ncbi:fused MFS/spermidine synthase [Candidatus Woesearchaeota archaeon]|nr:fused MFS/spermidine synthase [Candidatus Woesearchaeota archaeon]
MGNWKSRLLLAVLLITSFSSIVYEVVWGRQLSFVFGTSAFAITTVLTTFMAGLALGSLFGGRMIDRIEKKYQFLAYTEILIGITCLLTLSLLKVVKFPYFWIYEAFHGNLFLFTMALFILCFIMLIIPTFLVGVAFPTVVRLYFDELKMMGKSVGTTYMFDTIGGAFGAIMTGFFLIAVLGFFRVSVMASVLNIACGIVLLSIFWKKRFAAASSADAVRHSPVQDHSIMLILFFLSGFAALMFEVIWTRHIALIYGSSIHSFAIVLSSFLAGLGIGSVIASRYVDRIKEKIILFAFIELLIGVIGMALVVVFPALEKWFLYLFFHISSYSLFMFALLAVCFIIILIPTMLMGATLPVLSAVYVSDRKVGTDVGRLYSVNSFGSIFGSFMAGFVIIPAVGLAHSAILAGIIYIMIAIAFIYFFTDGLSKAGMKNLLVLTTLIILLGFIFLLSFYDPDYTYKGVYYHGIRYENESVIFQNNIEETTQLLMKRNSPYGTVTVFRSWDGSNVWLKNNGKTDASYGDSLTQGLLAHLPLALHDNPHKVLNIGLGGGFTLSSILKYEDVDAVDMIEIDPVVVEAGRTVLADYNNHALEDPRTNIIVADGRNYLFSTDRTYDLIISEPPNIWISGVSNLFTAEFYDIVRSHLDDGGIFSQWFPFYEMNEFDYRIALNTMRTVFPYLYEFNLGGDVIVIASGKRLDIYEDINRHRISYLDVDDDFTAMMMDSEKGYDFLYDEYGDFVDYDPYERNYAFLVSYYTRGAEDIDIYIGGLDLVNSDDLPILEFATLRNKYDKFEVKI